MPTIFDDLFALYEEKLHLLRNPTCQSCDAKIRAPVAVWHVGASYFDSAPRVLFIGKPHRGVPGHVRPSGVVDPRELVDNTLRFLAWPYWRYTRDIADLVHGRDRGWDRLAFTNLVKCTNVSAEGSSIDTTTSTMVKRCVLDLGVICAEAALLRPTHVVMYTARLFPEAIFDARLGGTTEWEDIARGTKPCGRKRLPWWHRAGESDWGPLKILITGHPERMSRRAYTTLVADWVRSA